MDDCVASWPLMPTQNDRTVGRGCLDVFGIRAFVGNAVLGPGPAIGADEPCGKFVCVKLAAGIGRDDVEAEAQKRRVHHMGENMREGSDVVDQHGAGVTWRERMAVKKVRHGPLDIPGAQYDARLGQFMRGQGIDPRLKRGQRFPVPDRRCAIGPLDRGKTARNRALEHALCSLLLY